MSLYVDMIVCQLFLLKFSSSNINYGYPRGRVWGSISYFCDNFCCLFIATSSGRISPMFWELVLHGYGHCSTCTWSPLSFMVLSWMTTSSTENKEVTLALYAHHQMTGAWRENKCKWQPSMHQLQHKQFQQFNRNFNFFIYLTKSCHPKSETI